ncbi:tripartite tricarboxylate transporter substrate-binding protein [Chloroflexota bacterium]
MGPKYLGIDIVVKNMPGAGSRTGCNYIFRSEPDGYTMGILDVEKLVATELLMDTEYAMEDFTFLGQVAKTTDAYYVHRDSPWTTIEDLRAAGNEEPLLMCETDYSPAGIIPFIEMEIPFDTITGYGGSGEAVAGLLAGDGNVIHFAVSSVLGFVKSGDLKPIFLMDDKVNPYFEELGIDVPTVGELGYPQLAGLVGPRLIVAPPDMPEEIASVLQEALWNTLHDEEFLAIMETAERPILPAPADECLDVVLGVQLMYEEYLDMIAYLYE